MTDPACIGQVIVAQLASEPNIVHATGLMIGYQDAPTVILETGPRKNTHWAAHLCRPATPDEAEAYWRQRAEAAEAKLERPIP